MATTLITNFSYKGKNPNFERDRVATLEALLDVNPANQEYDYGRIVFCVEDGKHYRFMYNYDAPDEANYNDTTGWFQEFAVGTSSGGTVTEAEIAQMGFTKNAGTVTGITINDGPVSEPTNGIVNLVIEQGSGTTVIDGVTDVIVDGVTVVSDNVAEIPLASTSSVGVVQLSNAVDSDSETKAASLAAVKTVNDKVNGKQDAISDIAEIRTNAANAFKGSINGVSEGTLWFVTKVNGIEPNGEGAVTIDVGDENVQSDWNETDANSDAYILNKPTFKTINNQSIVGSGNIEIAAADGGITSESDPVFMASAAAGITADDIEAWNNKSDFSGNYNDLSNKPTIPTALDQLTQSASHRTVTDTEKSTWDAKIDKDTADNTYLGKSAKAVSASSADNATNDGNGNDISDTYATKTELAGKMDKVTLATVATTGSYSDLDDKPTIPSIDGLATVEQLDAKQDVIDDLDTIRSGAAKGATALQSYTEKYTGTYTKPSDGIPESDLASAVQTSLDKAKNAFIGTVNYKSEGPVVAIDKILMNGSEYTPQGSETHVDLGVVAPAYAEYTGTSTAVKVTTKYGIFPTTSEGLVEGVRVAVKIEGALSLIKTLNVNGTGEKNVYYNGNSLSSGTIKQYNIYEFIYDGSYYRIIGVNTDTNTHYIAKNVVGASSSDKANVAATNGNVHLNLVENSTVRSSHSISGVGGVSVESDADGNILITGTSAYALVNHGTDDTTFTLTPNTFHVWGIVSSLTLTFGSETEGVANEYLFQFSCSSSVATTLSLPSSVMWADGETPTIEVMKTYQVSILNNCATIQSFG